jgi:hypothetical protein
LLGFANNAQTSRNPNLRRSIVRRRFFVKPRFTACHATGAAT